MSYLRSPGIGQVCGRRFSVLLILLLAACQGSHPPTQYYATGSNWAIYLAWTEDTAGHLQGQVQSIGVDPNDPAKLKSTNAAFTGTRNGQDISVSFPLISPFAGATWTGTLANNSLSLVIPTDGLPAHPTLVAGSFSDFERVANGIQSQVNIAEQQAQQQQVAVAQQQAVARAAAQQQYEQNRAASVALNTANYAASQSRSGYSRLQAALSNLAASVPVNPGPTSLSSRYSQAWQKMQATWAQEQQAAEVTPMTCYQKGHVQYIAGQVQYVLGQVQYLDGQAQYGLNQVQQNVEAANGGLATVLQWAPVLYQKAQLYSRLTGKPLTVPDPTYRLSALQDSTQESLKLYADRVQHFEGIVSSYDQEATQLDKQASAFPASIGCAG